MNRFKKSMITLSMVITGLVLLSGMNVFGANIENVNLYVDNEKFADGLAMIIDDCTMCGVRSVSEKFGCSVVWDEQTQGVTVYSYDGQTACGMAVGDSTAYYFDGTTSVMSGAPLLMNDTMMVPVRAIAEFLGKSVVWEEITSSVFIDSDTAYNTVTSTAEYRSEALARPAENRADAYLVNGDMYQALAELNTIDLSLLTVDTADRIQKKKADIEIQIQDYQDMQAVKKVVYPRSGNFNRVDIHSEPNWSSDVIFTVPYGNAVGFVRDMGNGFARIEYNGYYGYLEKAYLKDDPPPTFVTKVLYVANVTDSANIRNAPTTSGDVIVSVPIDNAVGYIEDCGDFYRVEYNGIYGYMGVAYLSDREPSRNVTQVLYVVNVKENASIRRAPNDNADVIKNVPLDNAVGYIADYGRYYRVEYNGTYGYMRASFLSNIPPSKSVLKVMYVTNVNNSASLRRTPSDNANVMAEVPLKGAVGYIADFGEYYRVEYNGQYGYMKKVYLTDTAPVWETVNTSSGAVYYTSSGSKYHRESCPTISSSRQVWRTDVSGAKNMGLTACKVCNP